MNFDNRVDFNDPQYEKDNTDYKFQDLDCVEIDGVDTTDFPDFCDAFFCYAEINGRPLTDDELLELGENYPEILGEMAYEYNI